MKRVIENPPRTGGRAGVVKRIWDLAGRRYRGVYPIDFHLVVTGEELHEGGLGAHAGTTKADLTVQGMYASQEMEDQIENVWEQLDDLVASTLQQRPRVLPTEPGSAGRRYPSAQDA